MRGSLLLVALGILGMGWMEEAEGQKREKTKVAIEHFEAGAGLEDVTVQVSDLLIARLVQHFTLLTRKDMDAVFAEHRFGFLDGVQSVAEFGKMLGAQKIILGRVDSVASSEAVRIRLRIVDVEQASLDLQEVVDIVPRERLREAVDLLSDLIIAKVPLRARIVRIRKDRTQINIGLSDNLQRDAELEVLRESEYGWITVGRLKVVSVSVYSSETNVVRQEEPFEEGQLVETVVDVERIKVLQKKLAEVGWEERRRLDRMAQEKKKLKEERLKTERAEQERLDRMAQEKHKLEEERLRAEWAREKLKGPKSRLRFGVGYFEPADEVFEESYYEGEGLDLSDPSFYSLAIYFLSHPYFRGYMKGTYFDREEPEPMQRSEEPERRKIMRSVLGARLQFPIGVPLVSIVPYAGGGGEYAYMKDSEMGEEGLHGMGYEFFFGAALVYRHSIGVFVEWIEEVVSVGEDEEDIGGTSVMAGVEIWW